MRALSWFFSIALLLMTSSPVFANDTLVVVTDYWPPFRIKTEEGVIGIDVDLLEEIGKRMGVHFEIRIAPWARCLLDMESGQADMMTGLARTSEREKYIDYTSIFYYQCAPAFYERKEREGRPIKHYDDLRNVSIGYTRGSAYFEPFDSDTKLDKIPATNEALLLNMLIEGRWDVIIGTDCQVDYDIKRLELHKKIIKTSYRPNKKVDLFFGMSKKSRFKYRMKEIETVIQDMLDDGTIKRIAHKYTGHD
ncbi:transporter substrate-binding domain-containing protein [Pseudodesulfovibrio sp. zrk46]|uniref:substrate-binding periplasmic protein n=1 Tax=Pseudodesulfovibrio sp. zrk46 TaxID=2725288 RepID=UPI001449E757|nr:transporter substrate-binding domain-containing protein [Pseudodesulfovibrio sp. zrk46]QJB55344.1 amino acid ABC transporter substrate-binding protein [Pseudodesulfovibrio sp. zrk46]